MGEPEDDLTTCDARGYSGSAVRGSSGRPRGLAQDARVAERVPAGLRPDAKAVRADADGDLGEQAPAAGRDRVDDTAVAARQPEHLPVGRDAAHVRAAAARNP